MSEPSRFLATTAPGLQMLLVEELRGFGLSPVLEPSGAVAVSGGWETAAVVLVRSRVASRLALSLRRFSSRNQAMLYDQIRRIDWPSVFPNTLSFSVEAMGTLPGADFTLAFATLKIKDAVCDEFRKRGQERPDVNRKHPGVALRAFFHNGRCELSLDLSGDPLHKRGYRLEGAEAPIRENRAAALLLFTGYDGSRPFLDPFCGSGTIAIEASLIATRTAPGLSRKAGAFAAARISAEAETAITREMDRARGACLPAPAHAIRGSDISESALETARANAARAGAGDWVEFVHMDAETLEAEGHWIVTNPPYGERLEDPVRAAALLREFVHRVKHHAVGSSLGMVLPRGDLEKAVGLRPGKKLSVESGPLSLRYLCYEIQSGRFQAGA